MSNSSWSPSESNSQLAFERAWLLGALLTGIAYGVVLILSFICLEELISRFRAGARGSKQCSCRRNSILIFYVAVMFILGTLNFVSIANSTLLAFVNDRNVPGGPATVEAQDFSVSIYEISNVVPVLASWCSQGVMIWRYVLIYKDCGFPLWIVALGPSLLFCGSVVTGVMWSIQISFPSFTFFHGRNYTLPYISLTFSTAIIVTSLIVLRIFVYRRRIITLFGPEHVTPYTSITAMLIESAALDCTLVLLVVIPFAMKNALAVLFLKLVGEAQIIPSLLIIYRVARGQAWSSDTGTRALESHNDTNTRLTRLSDMRFLEPSTIVGGSGDDRLKPLGVDPNLTEEEQFRDV